MNDCVNAEYRDQLPALLHDRIAGRELAALAGHLQGCADCREELELLRELRGMFAAATPTVSTTNIVAALPRPPLPAGVLPFRQRATRRLDWRIAAAAVLLVAGGGSFALWGAERAPSASQAVRSVVQGSAAPAAVASAATPAPSASAQVAATPVVTPATSTGGTDAELSMTGRLDDLSAQQLQSLLGDIENLQATPITEPEATVVPVTLGSDGPSGA